MVDSADKRRLLECKDELFKLLTEEKLAGASLLILANKQDLAGALTSDQIATVLELDNKIFHNRHCKILPCSAISGDGLLEGMDWMVEDVASRIYIMS